MKFSPNKSPNRSPQRKQSPKKQTETKVVDDERAITDLPDSQTNHSRQISEDIMMAKANVAPTPGASEQIQKKSQ